MKRGVRGDLHRRMFLLLLVVVLVLSSLNVAQAKGWLIPEAKGAVIENGVVVLSSMPLEEKVAQMVVVHGGMHNLEAWKRMRIGGIHLFAMESERKFASTIEAFQEGMQIPFVVTADLEGCLNPFGAFRNSTWVSEIEGEGSAFSKGRKDGRFLQKLGFGLNFAPVVDLNDEIWKCRSFKGDIAGLAESYILGLQSEGIVATAKHYPGKTLVVRDPHKHIVRATIEDEDVAVYEDMYGVVGAVMVSHIIVDGSVDSAGIPSVVSRNVLNGIRKDGFDGLIISDEINMLGLKDFYETQDEMYIGVFAAGNDIILNFDEDPNEVWRMIRVVSEAVRLGEISENEVDASVRRILEMKGFEVR